MADAVAVRTITDNPERIVVHLTNISDGTGESAVAKVDKSAIGAAIGGAEAASLDIERVQWMCDGMQVRILWDHTTDDVALVLNGVGEMSFVAEPGMSMGGGGCLRDPRTSGGTGDILLTTSGHTSGDAYDILLWLRKNPS